MHTHTHTYSKLLMEIQRTWRLLNNKNKFKWKEISSLNILNCQSHVLDYYKVKE